MVSAARAAVGVVSTQNARLALFSACIYALQASSKRRHACEKNTIKTSRCARTKRGPEARTRIAAHLYSVIAFMRASSNWQQLIDLMDRAFPKKGDTLPLLLTD